MVSIHKKQKPRYTGSVFFILSKPVSRVLYLMIIYLGLVLLRGSSHLRGSAGLPLILFHGVAPGGVYRAFPVARKPVSSYLTFPPLPSSTEGGLFLLHFPSSRLDRVLPGTLPDGARTFLMCCLWAMHTRPSGLLKLL